MTTWSTTEQTVTWTSTAGTTWRVVRGSTGGGGGGGASALNDLTDVDTATDPPATDDVLAWDGVTWTPATLTALGAPGLSNATPADLGTAAPGVSTEASRADHVHDMPTAAQVGALPDNTALLALGETSTTAYRGDRGKTAYDHSQITTGNPHGTTAADVGADPAGTAAGLVDDLSGVSNQATARTNLGLGTAATAATGDFAAASHTHTGSQVTVDASGFNGNLTTSDDTVQEVAQKVDDLVIPAAGIADPGGANDDFLQRKSGAWTNRTVAQVKSDLELPPVRPAAAYSTGEDAGLHFPVTIDGDTQNQSSSWAQYAFWWLFWVPTPKQVTCDVRVAALESGATARLSLWTTTDAAKPGTLVEDMGTVSAASTGVKSLTSSASVSGWVTVGVWQSNHSTVRYTRGTASTSLFSPYGMPKDHQVGRRPFCWYATGLNYSSAWNSTLPTLALANNTVVGQPTMVWMRWT